MTIEQVQARREKLGEEFQKAVDQRERLRQAHEDSGHIVERLRGAIVLCDEFIQTMRQRIPEGGGKVIEMPMPTPAPAPVTVPVPEESR